VANGKGDVQLSWMTVVGAISVAGLVAGAGWTIFQNEFANVKETASEDRRQAAVYYNTNKDDLNRATAEIGRRLDVLESQMAAITPKLAHDPVEQKTVDAINAATAKQLDQIQAEITDINRQIAAALIIIDNNAGMTRKTAPLLPP
jgi:hypothetical protein